MHQSIYWISYYSSGDSYCLEYPQHFRFSKRKLNSLLGRIQEVFSRVGSAPVWAQKPLKTIDFTDPGGRSPLPLKYASDSPPHPFHPSHFSYFD